MKGIIFAGQWNQTVSAHHGHEQAVFVMPSEQALRPALIQNGFPFSFL